MIEVSALPTELDDQAAVEVAYREALQQIFQRLDSGLSVLVRCDKQLNISLFRAIRNRYNSHRSQLRLISASNARDETGQLVQSSFMQRLMEQFAAAVNSATGNEIFVLTELDILTTVSRSGLSDHTRTFIAHLYQNPRMVMLAFQDSNLNLAEPIRDFFPVQLELIGLQRQLLPQLVLQTEARKFHDLHFNAYSLYKYVSGLNVLRFRQIMTQLHELPDFDPLAFGQRADPYAAIRSLTLAGDIELPSVSLTSDIGGYSEVKQALRRDVLELLQLKERLSTDGAAASEIRMLEQLIPKGIVLYGPPGTGKTFFAKAIATELNASIQIISGPELKSKWVGESEANLRRVFAKARQSAPAIIVFDEIDSFASARGTYTGSGVEHSMVNQLLTEMDGFRKEELIFVVATTNYLESVDSALLRPGRFELQLEIPYPHSEDRKAIVELYADRLGLEITADDVEYLVEQTGKPVDVHRDIHFSGDHLYALSRSLKRMALREKATLSSGTEDRFSVGRAHIDAAFNEVLGRTVSATELNAHERHVIATHECGHALCAELLPLSAGIKAIVLGDGSSNALGYVSRVSKNNRYVTTKGEFIADIAVLLGGRVAEELCFGDISGGAHDDLRRASRIAQLMVTELGMSSLGVRVLAGSGDAVSGALVAQMDLEISAILDQQLERVRELLSEHVPTLERMTAALLEHGRLSQETVQHILQASSSQ